MVEVVEDAAVIFEEAHLEEKIFDIEEKEPIIFTQAVILEYV